MLQLVPRFRLTMTDYQLEADMKATLDKMNSATSRKAKIYHWRKYQTLHKQRSPEMVAYLEAQRGLR